MSTRVSFYEEWRDLMRSWGFTVLEASGWRARDAEPGTSYDPSQLYVEHHDASTKLSGNWGALAYILQKKLANIVTARDGQIMLCAAGVEWHAGVGSHPGIPTNGANPRSMGNEVCNSGSESYSAACTRSIIAGEKAWMIVSRRRDAARVIGHKEWADPNGRKSDPQVSMDERRRQVTAYKPGNTTQQEDDMTPGQEAALDQARNNSIEANANSWQAKEDAGEARAMLGVVLGWQAPRSDNERAALVRLYGEDNVPDVDEGALALSLAPLLNANIAAVINGMPQQQLNDFAKAVNDERDARERARLGKS